MGGSAEPRKLQKINCYHHSTAQARSTISIATIAGRIGFFLCRTKQASQQPVQASKRLPYQGGKTSNQARAGSPIHVGESRKRRAGGGARTPDPDAGGAACFAHGSAACCGGVEVAGSAPSPSHHASPFRKPRPVLLSCSRLRLDFSLPPFLSPRKPRQGELVRGWVVDREKGAPRARRRTGRETSKQMAGRSPSVGLVKWRAEVSCVAGCNPAPGFLRFYGR